MSRKRYPFSVVVVVVFVFVLFVKTDVTFCHNRLKHFTRRLKNAPQTIRYSNTLLELADS